MTSRAKSLIDRIASWPDEDVRELDELAHEIEARRAGVYVVSDIAWGDLREAIRQADRKDFVPDGVVAESDKRHRK